MAEVVPEVVAYEEGGAHARSVDHARLIALLIEATKEQQAQIRHLQVEVQVPKALLSGDGRGIREY